MIAATVCSAADDTRFFDAALRQYRNETGERRPVESLPALDLSIVLRMAQNLKDKEKTK